MSKSKAPADISKRRQVNISKKQKDTEAPSAKKRIREILYVVGAVASILAVVAFIPRISAVPSDPVDSNNPFSASLRITNNSLIPLHHVTALVALGLAVKEPLVFTPREHPNFGEHDSLFTKPEWKDHILSMDESFTITPGDLIGCCGNAPVAGAEIAVIVEYTPWILPWKREKVFALVTHKQTNGNLYWYSIPNR